MLWTSVGAVMALGGLGYAFRGRLMEEYWIWKLSADAPAERRLAASKLAQMQPEDVVPRLLRVIATGGKTTTDSSPPDLESIITFHDTYFVQFAGGAPEISKAPEVIRALHRWYSSDPDVVAARSALTELGQNARPVLEKIAESETYGPALSLLASIQLAMSDDADTPQKTPFSHGHE